MRRNALITLLIFSILAFHVHVAQGYDTEKYTISVYPDGYVEVSMTISISEAEETVPLLGTPEDLMIYTVTGEPIYYEVGNDTIRVYFSEGERIVISYFTNDLTSKQGRIWTLSFNSSSDVKVIFPASATIVGLNVIPKEFSSSDEGLVIEFPMGNISVSYVLGREVEERSYLSSLTPFILLSIAVVLFGFLWIKKRSKKVGLKEYLREEDRAVIEFLKERGGQAFESEIRKHFILPKTSAWRLIKRLEKYGIVEVEKVGGQNLVKLKKEV